MKIRYPKALIGAAAVLAVAGTAMALPGAAQGSTGDDAAAPNGTAVVSEVIGEDCVIDLGDAEFMIDDWEPTPEELADINAETDELVAHLAANGHTFDVETDQYGFRYPTIEDADYTEELDNLINDFYTERYGDWEEAELLEGDWDDEEWADAELIDGDCIELDEFDGLDDSFVEALPGDHEVLAGE